MKPLPPEVSLGQLLDIIRGKKPKPVPRPKKPLNEFWVLSQPTVRYFKVNRGETLEQAWTRFLDEMPRKPFKFLALVAEQERKRVVANKVATKRAKGRVKYLKQMRRAALRASNASNE